VWHGKEVVLRRSRGYCPYPLLLPFQFEGQILACGAELKNAFCLTRGNYAFMSHHIGDLENLETLTSFEQGIEHFKRIFNIDPAYIAYDLHPDYLSTKYALSVNGVPKIGIQHHHAHIASCMCDNGIDGEIIGISFDGTGYGTDERIWGGEFLVCDYGGFERVAHLEYVPLPGGEKAIKEPWRMAASFLNRIYGNSMYELGIDFVKSLDRNKWTIIRRMIDKGLNSPLTSSSGRLFDAVSALVGVRQEVFYEGQAAIELEMAADKDEEGFYSYDLEEFGNGSQVMLEPIIRGIVTDIADKVSVPTIAGKFHNTMAKIILNICLRVRKASGIEKVALSGGVFQNTLLLNKTSTLLDGKGFKVYTQHRVPPNDGGIALGQAVIANELIKKGKI
jgi:hydrogenase maturation protein HypF